MAKSTNLQCQFPDWLLPILLVSMCLYSLSGPFATYSVFIAPTLKTLTAYLQTANKRWLNVCNFCLDSREYRRGESTLHLLELDVRE